MAKPFGATKKDLPFRAAIVRALGIADNDPEKLDVIAQKLVESAKDGKLDAIREIADRLDGKPAQTLQGDEENPLNVRHVIERIETVIIDPANTEGENIPPPAEPGKI